MAPAFELRAERAADSLLVEGLIERAFGPGRYAKAAERLREGSQPVRELSFVAWRGESAVGCVRMWPIAIGESPALLLGPFAVEASERSAGVGAALIQRACDAAQAAGHAIVLLVGDQSYFGQLGFCQTKGVRMPGPVDPRRVLARTLVPNAIEGLGGDVRVARPIEREPLALAAE